MNIKQPDTLFQTMEKWLIAYQAKYNCTEDTALDKFDEMSDIIRATGKGETATEFHNSVKASLEEITPRKSVTCQVIPDDYIFDDFGTKPEIIIGGRRACDTEQSRIPQVKVEYHATTGKVVKSSVTPISLPAHVGGPLLETGVDPLGFVSGSLDFLGIAKKGRTLHEVMTRVPDPDALEKADATILELNAQAAEGSGKAARRLINHEESIQIEIDYLVKMVDQYKRLGEPDKEHPAYELHMLHVNRLAMLEELQKRQKVRTGRTLTLKRPSL